MFASFIITHTLLCFLGDEAAVRQVEHHAEGVSSGSTSAQPAPRLHESFTEGGHYTDGDGEAGRMGRLPGPCAVSVQDVHQPYDQVQPVLPHVQQES